VDHLVVGDLGDVGALLLTGGVAVREEVGSTREMQVPVKRMRLWMALTVALWTLVCMMQWLLGTACSVIQVTYAFHALV
jgi:hypothetical protein